MKSPFNLRSLCGRQPNFKFTSLAIDTVEAISDAFPEGASACVPEVHGIYQRASSARQSNCGTSEGGDLHISHDALVQELYTSTKNGGLRRSRAAIFSGF